MSIFISGKIEHGADALTVRNISLGSSLATKVRTESLVFSYCKVVYCCLKREELTRDTIAERGNSLEINKIQAPKDTYLLLLEGNI